MSVTIVWPLAFSSSSVLMPTISGAVEVSATNPALRRQDDLPRMGLKLPLGANKLGRGYTITGDSQDQKIINTALSSNDNSNAFQQDPGLGESMIFDISDPAVRGRIMSRLRLVFDEFTLQNRYKLLEDTLQWDESDGELNLTFKYANLETDDVKDFDKGYREGV